MRHINWLLKYLIQQLVYQMGFATALWMKWSRIKAYNDFKSFAPPIVISSVEGFGEPTGLIYDEDTGVLLEADRQERLMGINVSNAVFTEIAPAVQGAPTLRGLMFFPSKQDLIFYDGVNLNNAP